MSIAFNIIGFLCLFIGIGLYGFNFKKKFYDYRDDFNLTFFKKNIKYLLIPALIFVCGTLLIGGGYYTSNVGFEKNNIGFNKNNDNINCLKNRFSTSFINRIDGIMTFNRLSEDDVRKIITNKLEIINKKHSDINITYADDVIDKIIKESDFYEFGARRLDKIISRGIENIILEAIINNVKDVYIDKLNEYEKNITKS